MSRNDMETTGTFVKDLGALALDPMLDNDPSPSNMGDEADLAVICQGVLDAKDDVLEVDGKETTLEDIILRDEEAVTSPDRNVSELSDQDKCDPLYLLTLHSFCLPVGKYSLDNLKQSDAANLVGFVVPIAPRLDHLVAPKIANESKKTGKKEATVKGKKETMGGRRNQNRPDVYQKHAKLTLVREPLEFMILPLVARRNKDVATQLRKDLREAKYRARYHHRKAAKAPKKRGPYKCGSCSSKLKAHVCPFVKIRVEVWDEVAKCVPPGLLKQAALTASPIEN
ncbi:expressed unknown protein [Seminavis robusta]|uniref:Uncharacterized protein n=1 Tax=Seminavis robusta TaxID=568900 RepID=A0A9N8HAY5_9STRA|nr:expressed unknown protein [Seminavis robusta]|eukprot:Sro164_g073470.1 n/a (283) ;mRNA; f:11369-12217